MGLDMSEIRIVYTSSVFINNWKMNYQSFEKLVTASHKAKRLVLRAVQWDTDYPLNFTGSTEYSIEYIGLAYTGREKFSNWGEKPQRLENIIQAIANCGLANSVQVISMHEFGLTEQQVKDMLVKYDLSHINLAISDPIPIPI